MKQLTMNAIGVENYDAAKVHTNFIIEMTRGLKHDLSQKVDLAQNSILQHQMQMWAFLRTYGGQMFKQYVHAILRVPPRQVAELFTDVLVCLSVEFRLEDNLA